MWVLIFIEVVIGTSRFDVHSEPMGVYDSMNECFVGRELLIMPDEFPPPNTQFVCIRIQDS
jgi:hypothetical protein